MGVLSFDLDLGLELDSDQMGRRGKPNRDESPARKKEDQAHEFSSRIPRAG